MWRSNMMTGCCNRFRHACGPHLGGLPAMNRERNEENRTERTRPETYREKAGMHHDETADSATRLRNHTETPMRYPFAFVRHSKPRYPDENGSDGVCSRWGFEYFCGRAAIPDLGNLFGEVVFFGASFGASSAGDGCDRHGRDLGHVQAQGGGN